MKACGNYNRVDVDAVYEILKYKYNFVCFNALGSNVSK